jgi:hypothetical protein
MTTQILRSAIASTRSNSSMELNARFQNIPELELEEAISADSEPPEREAVRLLVIGSRSSVTNIVQTLHRLGFAEAGEWSPFLPGPNPGEVMRILMRYILKS